MFTWCTYFFNRPSVFLYRLLRKIDLTSQCHTIVTIKRVFIINYAIPAHPKIPKNLCLSVQKKYFTEKCGLTYSELFFSAEKMLANKKFPRLPNGQESLPVIFNINTEVPYGSFIHHIRSYWFTTKSKKITESNQTNKLFKSQDHNKV